MFYSAALMSKTGNTKAPLLCKTEQEADGEECVCWGQAGQEENWQIPALQPPLPISTDGS